MEGEDETFRFPACQSLASVSDGVVAPNFRTGWRGGEEDDLTTTEQGPQIGRLERAVDSELWRKDNNEELNLGRIGKKKRVRKKMARGGEEDEVIIS